MFSSRAGHLIVVILGFLVALGLTAGMDLALAAAFWVTWNDPHVLGDGSVLNLAMLLLLEFPLLMGVTVAIRLSLNSLPWRVRMVGLFFGMMPAFLTALGFCIPYGNAWPLWALFFVLIPKMSGVFLSPYDEEQQTYVLHDSGLGGAWFMIALIAGVVLPVPPLGVSQDIIAEQTRHIGGVLGEQPYKLLAVGAIYFAGTALLAIRAEVSNLLLRLEDVPGD